METKTISITKAKTATPADTAYLLNAWYAAALSREVQGQGLFHRKILDTSILIYRKEDGTPVAMHDRCPHRFAPLHLGKRQGDDIVCIYHALRFDCTGKCTHNPHGTGLIPKDGLSPLSSVGNFHLPC